MICDNSGTPNRHPEKEIITTVDYEETQLPKQ
jgi:hypothetical protein